MTNKKLEDFGMRQSTSPAQRKAEYAKQCRKLDPEQQAPFWMSVMKHDPEVAKLVKFKVVKSRT